MNAEQWIDRLVALAYRGLPRMLVDDGRMVCFRALDAGNGELRLEGTSAVYNSMCVVGLKLQERLGRRAGFDAQPLLDSAAQWGLDAPDIGHAGLGLWAVVAANDDRAEHVAKRIVSRADEARRTEYCSSMELGYLLIGLSEAMRAGIGGLDDFAAEVAARLRGNQDASTGIFSFAAKLRRKNIHKARRDAVLGSFASQVYPTVGFSAYARATGREDALEVARRCADAIVRLQGPQGQWWWVFHAKKDVAAVKYPVYTVHQDAMGAMALLSAALADGGHRRYDEAVLKSMQWFDDRPECKDSQLLDDEGGVVWRAVQHDDPALTKQMGLSDGELARMGRRAWFGGADTRALAPGFVCPECRPYNLGWTLVAAALYAELSAAG